MYNQNGNEIKNIRQKRFAPIIPLMEYTLSKVAIAFTSGLISEMISNNTGEA